MLDTILLGLVMTFNESVNVFIYSQELAMCFGKFWLVRIYCYMVLLLYCYIVLKQCSNETMKPYYIKCPTINNRPSTGNDYL